MRKKKQLIQSYLLVCILLLAVNAAYASSVINLPKPKESGQISVEETLAKRRSTREFENRELSQEQISQILWSLQGITEKTWMFRTAPSAGSLYPLEVYIFKSDGVYHYLPEKHAMEKLSSEDRRQALAQAALGQSSISEAPVNFVIAAAYERTRSKYGGRAERYVYMEAGHAAENLHLQAVAMGLGSLPVGAFWDEITARIANLPKEQYPLYIIPVGYPKET